MPEDPQRHVVLTDLEPLSKQLNAATDEFNEALRTIEGTINALALGVEAWLDGPDQLLGRRVQNTWCELDGQVVREWSDDDAQFIKESRSFQVQELGYGRLGDGWVLLVRSRRGLEVKNAGGWEVEESAWSDIERKPLLHAARQIRVKAVDLIPDLIAKLRSEASTVISAVEKAKQIAETLR